MEILEGIRVISGVWFTEIKVSAKRPMAVGSEASKSSILAPAASWNVTVSKRLSCRTTYIYIYI